MRLARRARKSILLACYEEKLSLRVRAEGRALRPADSASGGVMVAGIVLRIHPTAAEPDPRPHARDSRRLRRCQRSDLLDRPSSGWGLQCSAIELRVDGHDGELLGQLVPLDFFEVVALVEAVGGFHWGGRA